MLAQRVAGRPDPGRAAGPAGSPRPGQAGPCPAGRAVRRGDGPGRARGRPGQRPGGRAGRRTDRGAGRANEAVSSTCCWAHAAAGGAVVVATPQPGGRGGRRPRHPAPAGRAGGCVTAGRAASWSAATGVARTFGEGRARGRRRPRRRLPSCWPAQRIAVTGRLRVGQVHPAAPAGRPGRPHPRHGRAGRRSAARDGCGPAWSASCSRARACSPPLDVTENVALPLLLAGVRSEADALAAPGAPWTGSAWPTWPRELPEELSGGQAQRVAVGPGAGRAAPADPGRRADRPARPRAPAPHVVESCWTAAERAGRGAACVTTHDPAVAERLPTAGRWPTGGLPAAAAGR